MAEKPHRVRVTRPGCAQNPGFICNQRRNAQVQSDYQETGNPAGVENLMDDTNRKTEGRGPSALIRLGYSCNNNCIFCHSSEARRTCGELATGRAMEKVKQASELGAGAIVFTGGEPTIREDLFDILDYTRSLGLGAGMITNGRMFCYGDFAERIARIGLDYVLVSLHGPDAGTHNELTGTDSYRQTLKGLAAVSGIADRVVVNTVLTRLNAERLRETAEIIERFAPVHFKVSLPEPRGGILERFDIVAHPRAAAAAIAEFINDYPAGRGVSIGVDGLTPCLLRNYHSLNDNFFTHGIYILSEPGEDAFFQPTYGIRGFAGECTTCSMYHACPGLYLKYFDVFPGMELAPLNKRLTGSIHYSFSFRDECGHGAECAKHPVRSPRPERMIPVESGTGLDVYETTESAVDTPGLLRLKVGLGQVYMPLRAEGGGGAGRTSARLEASRECRECPRLKLNMCPGVFRQPEQQPVDGLEKLVGDVLSETGGRLCELGCRRNPLTHVVRRLVNSGAVDYYLGVDSALQGDNESFSGERAEFVCCEPDDFQWDGRPFDSVLLSFCFHTLESPLRAGRLIDGMTGSGARVTVVERAMRIELAGGEGPPGEGGALCNHHNAAEAAKYFEYMGFEPEILLEPAAGGADCWALTAVKP